MCALFLRQTNYNQDFKSIFQTQYLYSLHYSDLTVKIFLLNGKISGTTF